MDTEPAPQGFKETSERILEKVKALVDLFDTNDDTARQKVKVFNKMTVYSWLVNAAPMENNADRWNELGQFFQDCVGYYIDIIVASYQGLNDPRSIIRHTVKKYHNLKLYLKVLEVYFMYMGRQLQCIPNLLKLIEDESPAVSERLISGTDGQQKLHRCALMILRDSPMSAVIDKKIIGALVTLASERRKAFCDSVSPTEVDLSQDEDFLNFQQTVSLITDLGKPSENKLFDELHKRLCEECRVFYQSTSVEWAGQYSCYDYFHKAQSAQSFEAKAAAVYLPLNVQQDIMSEFCFAAVAAHQAQVLAKGSGIAHMLTTFSADFVAQGPALLSTAGNTLAPIACVYKLLSDVEALVLSPGESKVSKLSWDASQHGLCALRDAALQFVQNELKELDDKYVPKVKDSEEKPAASKSERGGGGGADAVKVDAVGLITEFVKAKIKYDFLIVEACKDDVSFHKVVHKAYAEAVNESTRCAEYMSLFIHQNMRNNTVESESYFPIFVDILERLLDKDVFFEYYKRHFSQRLLGDRDGLNMDLENNFLSLLKQRMSMSQLFHLEKMYHDIQTSESLIGLFKEYASNRDAPVVDLGNTAVLTQGHWPKIYTKQGAIPLALERTCGMFDEFYKQKHSGRVLSWDMTKGRAELKMLSCKCTLEVSTPQLCILLRFNDTDTLDVSTLYTDIGFDARTQKMVKQNYEFMTKPNKKKYWNELLKLDGNTLSVNEAFKSRTNKAKFCLESTARPTDHGSHKDVEKNISADRGYEMQAVLVRVMKSNKGAKVKLANLISQATTICQARFMPSPQALKQQIERLIEMEYFRRSEDDRASLEYLA